MKYYIITYGCQMNKSDSERIAWLLERKGYKPAKTEKGADLIVINMCSVRQTSVNRAFGRITSLKGKKVMLTGCILKHDRDKLKNKVEIVDFENLFKEKSKIRYLEGFVPIMEGCNNFCSYCVVPFTRGRERYRSKKEIIKEAKILIEKGIKEITLLGQNIASYPTLPGLIKNLDKMKGNFSFSFLTSHPKDFSDRLIRAMRESKKLKKYIHLPVQSGNNGILKKMKRGYTREQYLELIEKIRKEIPDIQISTDVIVGFPGETKKQFKDTLDLLKKVGFDNAYISPYSPRFGTAASKMKDNVSLKEKNQRAEALRKIFT